MSVAKYFDEAHGFWVTGTVLLAKIGYMSPEDSSPPASIYVAVRPNGVAMPVIQASARGRAGTCCARRLASASAS
jgi:hypothetical protein